MYVSHGRLSTFFKFVMGNQQTNVLKDKYLKGDFKIRDSYKDNHLGLVSVFELQSNLSYG